MRWLGSDVLVEEVSKGKGLGWLTVGSGKGRVEVDDLSPKLVSSGKWTRKVVLAFRAVAKGERPPVNAHRWEFILQGDSGKIRRMDRYQDTNVSTSVCALLPVHFTVSTYTQGWNATAGRCLGRVGTTSVVRHPFTDYGSSDFSQHCVALRGPLVHL